MNNNIILHVYKKKEYIRKKNIDICHKVEYNENRRFSKSNM